MSGTNWIGRNVSRLLPAQPFKQKEAETKEALAQAAIKTGAKTAAPQAVAARSIPMRLEATLRQEDEALSPRLLRRALQELQAIIDPRVSEVEGGRRAMEVAAWYALAPPAQRRDLWLLMSEIFVADAQKTKDAQARFAAAVGTPDEAVAEVHYRRATVSPRRRLLQRFSVYPQGVRFLVDLRAEMLPFLKADKRLMALDVELEYMFSTWFDVGFLDLRRISWDSPASLIEKLIQYEAVHDIKSWADVKNRLDSDRRCYGFFHPRLPGVPLIFVEVALVDEMAAGIMPLLDEHAAASDLEQGDDGHFLLDQQHPARFARREFWRFADQARGGNAQGRVSQAQGVCHAVADSRLSELARQRMPLPCWTSWPTRSARRWAAPSVPSRSRPAASWRPLKVRWSCPKNRRFASCCCSAPRITSGRGCKTASRWTRWRGFTWATAPASSASTGPPTRRPRASSSLTA